MRELFRIIKENFLLLLGTGLFSHSLFSFNSSYNRGIDIPIREAIKKISEIRTYPISTYYYYDSTELILLTIGAILIVIGLIKIREKKDKN